MYIIGKSKVPVALIETGFMSNESDLEFIIKKENQEKMAEYIYQAVMKAFSQLETE
ncbi:MAG: N-acetylmuramoyl-L-alanine amidase [Acetivibrio ethanolgignens]